MKPPELRSHLRGAIEISTGIERIATIDQLASASSYCSECDDWMDWIFRHASA
jgi:hypothetical protein